VRTRDIPAGYAGGSQSLAGNFRYFGPCGVGFGPITGTLPQAEVMGVVGVLALFVNGGAAFLLYRYRGGDSNMRSVWICSRNDALGNVAVMLAALGVFGTGTGWPDIIVASVMAALSLWGAAQIINHAWNELRTGEGKARSSVPAE
jgi:Co/Zn/Cd efflux system component